MKKKKIGLILCIVLLVYFVGGIIYSFSGIGNRNKDKLKEEPGIHIKGFDYFCKESEFKLYKNEFMNLKSILESDEIDYAKYAESISKLFISDLYNLKNKKNMYDVGGVDYVYPESRDNYKLNVENTLYKYMEDIDDGKRKQKLPEVSSVEVTNFEETEYSIGDEKYDGYKINIDITYVEDLEYDIKSEVILIKLDKYLYVVEKN